MTDLASRPAQAPEAGARRRRAIGAQRLSDATILLLLIGMIAAFSVLTPAGTFLSLSNFESVLLTASQLLILSCGTTFLLIAGGLDLSIGAVTVFSAVVVAKVMGALAGTAAQAADFQYPNLAVAVAAAVGGGLAVGLGWGVLNGVLAVRTRIPPFIATLATGGIVLGLASVWTDGQNVQNVPLPFQTGFGLGKLFGVVPWPIVIAAVVTAVSWVLLAKTRFGLHTYAMGANLEAARRAGIDVGRHMVLLYAGMGALCGLVAIIDVGRFGTASITSHSGDGLAAIAAVVIGGTSLFGGRGRISGTIVGALIPAVLQSGFVIMDVQPFWQNVAVGVVLLVAVYVDQVKIRAQTRA
ncbi:ribose transport system permease protein [Thermocatellispora tengchongensis]|uniref:Ribose transport system permease protein n=1 Tax=Thermocatellispora tengchongensis TaxID=1073253 RepID=A0A840P4Y0_9ACTN|nr:ABC transporter permease [Thermocatellispora tengchongensis]MBB5134402.1 ribose transport system permease protein [Thermocatellispora tengchongensis]